VFEEIGGASFTDRRGDNAVVYSLEVIELENICFKKIKPKPRIVYNNIDEEHAYQKKIKEAGVRTPFSLLSIETEEKEKYIVMQKINGHSVRDIIKNPNLLPEKFNYEVFCKSLDEEVAKMHKIGIHHRDLHSGNVMINEEGLPVIIDFGTATEGSGGESTYDDMVSMLDNRTGRYVPAKGYFKNDLDMVKNIKADLRFLENKS